ncbi:MAG: hypothetical protein ABIJ56_08470 [Pseudomonadota bacterium]
MFREEYRHRQSGWVIIVAMALFYLILVPVQLAIGEYGFLTLLFLLPPIGVLLFGWMTVVVDDHEVRFHMGMGLVRKHFTHSDIRTFRKVRNSWILGWGIHGFPGGLLYNVSGFWAVELLLRSGKRVRIGTDEPDALCRAIEKKIGTPEPLTASEQDQVKRSTRRGLIILAVFLAFLAAGIAAMVVVFHHESGPPKVTVSPEAFKVESLIYEEEFAMQEISSISLEQCIPRIIIRTNGYGGARSQRGHFRLEELGEGQLFIEVGIPPYVLIRTYTEYVIVNFEDPARTQRLFEELEAVWPGRREGTVLLR